MNEAIIAGTLALLNTGLTFALNEQKLREVVAQAVLEGRSLTAEELQVFADDAQDAIDTARNND